MGRLYFGTWRDIKGREERRLEQGWMVEWGMRIYG